MDCGEVFDHDRFHCRCPQCGGANVRLLHGRELDIASIEIETPDD
ncbi:MAG: hydrogenase/urease maturation nickel metallochaperone HypA [Collinsella sp.]|nr:hydrogenase/urease maturation nickel metallochaperone HypA [Collinsella sp.]